MSGGSIGAWRGAALYVGSLVGPGLLLIPALAARAAGPAAIVAWIALIVVSAPLAAMFALLGVRHPTAGGVAAYAEAALGRRAGVVVGGWMLTAIAIGAPAVSVMGGFYVSDLVGGGWRLACAVGFAIFVVVLGLNALGVRISASVQTALSALLVAVLAVGVVGALPHVSSSRWHPFAPRGYGAIGTSASILIWLYVGWEAVAQLVAEFRRPARDLPRAIGGAFAVVTVMYVGLAVVTIAAPTVAGGRVPLAGLLEISLGETGRRVAAMLAVVLTMGTMNVYVAGGAKLAGAFAEANVLPRVVRDPVGRARPRRPLGALGLIGCGILGALLAGVVTTDALIRATSACFVAVYLASAVAGLRLLPKRLRLLAVAGGLPMVAVAAFSGPYLLVPCVSAVVWGIGAHPRSSRAVAVG